MSETRSTPKPVGGTTIAFRLPLRTVSLANEHRHWRVRQQRTKAERLAVWAAWRAENGRSLEPAERALVYLTRFSPGTLDSDNLPASMKSIRDQIAECLGLDDRSERITWAYFQATGPYAVWVHVEIA